MTYSETIIKCCRNGKLANGYQTKHKSLQTNMTIDKHGDVPHHWPRLGDQRLNGV